MYRFIAAYVFAVFVVCNLELYSSYTIILFQNTQAAVLFLLDRFFWSSLLSNFSDVGVFYKEEGRSSHNGNDENVETKLVLLIICCCCNVSYFLVVFVKFAARFAFDCSLKLLLFFFIAIVGLLLIQMFHIFHLCCDIPVIIKSEIPDWLELDRNPIKNC